MFKEPLDNSTLKCIINNSLNYATYIFSRNVSNFIWGRHGNHYKRCSNFMFESTESNQLNNFEINFHCKGFRNLYVYIQSVCKKLVQFYWLHFYRTQVYLGSDLWVCFSLTERPFWNLTDVTLADEDTNSILTNNANRAIQGNVVMQLMQVALSGAI